MEEELQMTFKLPYFFPYFLLIFFNAVAFAVNAFYDNLNNGTWTPVGGVYPFAAVQLELFRQRPYEVQFYIMNSLATLIFLVYMLMPKGERSNQTETKMVVRWFLHIIAFIFVLIMWILALSQLWIYKICLYSSQADLRITSNSEWNDPIYTIMYCILIAYGLLVAVPCIVYLLWLYFVKAESNYRDNPQTVYVHKVFNKICYFATYISIITVMGLNLSYLSDYETYFVNEIYPLNPFASLQVQLSLPVQYLEYFFSGLALLFAAFLLVKEIFETMKSKKKHIRRQLLVITSTILCIGILTINKIIEVTRQNEVIKTSGRQPNQSFLQLYDHTRTIMWCYLFLLFPVIIYSIRNYWREWKNQFASGQQTEYSVSGEHHLADNSHADHPNKGNPYQDNRPLTAGNGQYKRNEGPLERLVQPLVQRIED